MPLNNKQTNKQTKDCQEKIYCYLDYNEKSPVKTGVKKISQWITIKIEF